jgi:hypothetical protein
MRQFDSCLTEGGVSWVRGVRGNPHVNIADSHSVNYRHIRRQIRRVDKRAQGDSLALTHTFLLWHFAGVCKGDHSSTNG